MGDTYQVHPTNRYGEYLFARPIIAYDFQRDEKLEFSFTQIFVIWVLKGTFKVSRIDASNS